MHAFGAAGNLGPRVGSPVLGLRTAGAWAAPRDGALIVEDVRAREEPR